MTWIIKKVNRIPKHCDVTYESVCSIARGHMIKVWVLSGWSRCAWLATNQPMLVVFMGQYSLILASMNTGTILLSPIVLSTSNVTGNDALQRTNVPVYVCLITSAYAIYTISLEKFVCLWSQRRIDYCTLVQFVQGWQSTVKCYVTFNQLRIMTLYWILHGTYIKMRT